MHNTEERNLSKLGGLARQMPVVAIIFSVGGLGALGLPSTSGFAAEFLVFLGSFTSTMVVGIKVLTILAILGVVLTAGYILWLVQRVFYGPVLEEFNWVADADTLEKVYAGCFIAVIMLVGIYPAILTDVIKLGVLPMVGG
jgi:NADH-quinone oxidoreductase subunit M